MKLQDVLKKYSFPDEIVDVLLTDTEAFPRRAAANFVCAWHLTDPKAVDRTLPLMKKTIADFDWQVKISTLEFWRKYLSSTDALAQFTRSAGSVLINGILDCDRSVQRTACSIVVEVYAPLMKSPSNVSDVDLSKEEWTLEEFINALGFLDVQQRLIEASASIDEYADNPMSLIRDIMTSLKAAKKKGGAEENGDEETFQVDCY
jgi:hypothetical protein